MNQRTTPLSHSLFSKSNLFRISVLLAFAVLVLVPVFTVSSASLLQKSVSHTGSVQVTEPVASMSANRSSLPLISPLLTFMPQGPGEEIATYAADCTTPQSTFEVGDTACAKATGPINDTYKIHWVNAQGEGVETDLISAANPTATWVVTASGNWKAYLSDSDSLRALVHFGGSDPDVPAVDLSVSDSAVGSSGFVSDGVITYEVWVLNNGPDVASNVSLVQTVPNNAVRQVSSQDSGPAFTCTDNALDTTCTIASLGSGASAYFTFVYKLNNGVAPGTLISTTATVSSSTSELHAPDNSSATENTVGAGAAPASCSLVCPSNITTVANTTQNGNPGAFVTFSSAEGVGTCGEVSSSSASNSFFPVGTTVVTVTSSEGGGGCTFDVVVEPAGSGPSISCPADQSVTAASGDTTATVDPGTPTTTPASGVSVSGLRNDNQDLTDPYPVGSTFITWTVTDSSGLTSSCSQRITVNSNACGTDTENPTITAPDDVSITTPPNTLGSCGFVVGEGSLGSPTAADNCTFNVARTGVPAGNFFPVGETTVTYTVTDAAGNSASDTQKVTVIDGSNPVIEAPADASYTCQSEVPAANPSQATRGEVLDENGNPLPPGPPVDNCGAPTVTVTETTSGDGSTSSPLIITRTFTATDAAGNSASDDQVITVIDPTSPTITAPADASFQCASEVPAASAGDATAADNCGAPTVTVSDVSNNGAGSAASPLVITRTFTATDTAGNTASDSQTITVIDNTAPTVSAPADASYQCATDVPAANAGDATASDNCGSPTVTVSEANNGGAGSISSPLIITRTYTATDAVGNSASDSQTITVIDNTPPVISCPANITVFLPANSPDTSMPVTYAAPTATDNCSAATVTTNVASGSVFPVGTTTITATATDDKNNSSSCTFTVTVLYNFTGFFSPVDNLPILNTVNAGRAIPVKFSLSGNKGLAIFAANSPYSSPINCDGSAAQSEVEETLTAGGSSLSYNAASDQYHYVWKTENSWAGTCRQLVVKLNDGSEHRANFKFR